MREDDLIVSRTIHIPVPLDEVWEFVTDEERMKEWFQADEFIIEFWEGGKIEIPISFSGQEVMVEGEMGLLYPNRKFYFTWNERDETGENWFYGTLVQIELEEEDSGTRLKLVHDGFKRLPPEIREQVHKRYIYYWGQSGILDRLLRLVMRDSGSS